jgi:hypothetical protein
MATLEHHLIELVRLNEKLLDMSRRRREAIAGRDVAQLEILLGEEQKVAMAVFEEERRRRVTMAKVVGPALGQKPEAMAMMKLADVLKSLPGEDARRLEALAARLHEVTRTIQRVNQEATLLTQRFLPYFEELLGILVDGTMGRPSYTHGGQSARAGRANMNVVDVTG